MHLLREVDRRELGAGDATLDLARLDTDVVRTTPQKVTVDMGVKIMDLGVEGMMISPGYSYEKAPDQQHFLARENARELYRQILSNRSKKWRFNQSPLFLEFLMGKRDYDCTPWGIPTYNIFGWQKPCYLLGEGYVKTFKELIEGKRESYVMERRYHHKSGRTFWARVNYSLVRDLEGRPDYLVGIIEDIDDQKRAAQRLADQEADYLLTLQHRVNERTHELEEANQKLQKEIEQRIKIETELAERAAEDTLGLLRSLRRPRGQAPQPDATVFRIPGQRPGRRRDGGAGGFAPNRGPGRSCTVGTARTSPRRGAGPRRPPGAGSLHRGRGSA